jgi:para-nitrobenzyl esterase
LRRASLLTALILATLAGVDQLTAAPRKVGDGQKGTAGYVIKPEPGPAVKIDAGQVRGLVVGEDKGVLSYKGIPYAKPPVGDLRWRDPQPPPKWEGVRDCFEFGHVCMQKSDALIKSIPQLALRAPESEDCLYLNVWAPANAPKAKLPVLFWIHGGGYTTGASSQPLYDGESLVGKGVVLVTVNYRLGPFGFLAHPALTKESDHHASGNYGLLDQIEALKWVKRNIASFGGDPDRVTIFGESAGGGSVVCLMTSPLARGLFHGAIAQSPGGLDLARLKQSTSQRKSGEEQGAEAIAKSGLPADADTAAMRKLDARKLVDTASGGGPLVDGYVILDTPQVVFTAGKESPVPFIIGHTRDEETLFLTPASLPKTVADYRKKIDDTFGGQAAAVAALYPAEADKDIRDASVRLMTDMRWGAPVRHAARLHSSKGYPTYRYVFSRGSKQPFLSALKAHHGCELAYVFGVQAPDDPEARKVIDLVQGYWANFAAKGDPNGNGLPKWPKFTSGADPLMEFENDAEVREHYREKYLDAVEKHQGAPRAGADNSTKSK